MNVKTQIFLAFLLTTIFAISLVEAYNIATAPIATAPTKLYICPSEEQIIASIKDCKLKGLEYYTTVDNYGCKIAKCIDVIKTCPSDEEIEKAISACKENGGYKISVNEYGCKVVECVAIVAENQTTGPGTVTYLQCPSQTTLDTQVIKCKDAGMDYEYYTDSAGCVQVRCKERRSICPSVNELEAAIMQCKKMGLDYEYYTEYPATGTALTECKMVRCTQRLCPSEEEIEKKAEICKENGFEYQKYIDDKGCKMVKCLEGNVICPAPEALQNIIENCKKRQLEFETYEDSNGCKQVKCKQPSTKITVECKKFVEANCIIIYCADGYIFNSCELPNICPVIECKKFKDEEGCIVKKCSNGYEARECPNREEIEECKVYTRDDGCLVKKCTDGKEYVSCPEETKACKKFKDEEGCVIKECEDGSKEKVCPVTAVKSQDIECKVYKDEQGCEIKECSNGYEYNSCEATKLQCKERVENNCIIKECSDGSILKFCSGKETVECKNYETPEGCKAMICTNGYEEKVCPETQKPIAVTPAQPTIIEIILKFFRGGK